MSDKESIKDRLKEFIRYINIPISTFEKNCSLSNGYVSSIRKGIGHKALEQISKNYPELDTGWLLTGEGEMLKVGKKATNDEATLIIDKNIIQIPLVSQYAYAGYLGGFDDPEYVETLPTIPIFIDRELKGNYLGFEVRGDSMEDGTDSSIKEGDILISREVKKEYWKYKLHIDKWNFVIVHKIEGVLVKRIIKHEVEKGIIKIHSLNLLYEDEDISLNEVAQLFNVVQVVRKFKI